MKTKKSPKINVYKDFGDIDVNYVSVDSVLEALQAEKDSALSQGYTDLQLDYRECRYDDSRTYFVRASRLETDEEYNKRLGIQSEQEKAREAQEYQQYLILKQKFDK